MRTEMDIYYFCNKTELVNCMVKDMAVLAKLLNYYLLHCHSCLNTAVILDIFDRYYSIQHLTFEFPTPSSTINLYQQ